MFRGMICRPSVSGRKASCTGVAPFACQTIGPSSCSSRNTKLCSFQNRSATWPPSAAIVASWITSWLSFVQARTSCSASQYARPSSLSSGIHAFCLVVAGESRVRQRSAIFAPALYSLAPNPREP